MATYHGTTGNDSYLGTTGNDMIHGNAGNDTLNGNGGQDHIDGGAGNDTITISGTGGGGSGGEGNDIFYSTKQGYGQYHLWGDRGNDRFVISLANQVGWGSQGHHLYGGEGADQFEFTGVSLTNEYSFSRIDDFDASRDSIWVSGVKLNFAALPSNMRVVNYVGQQFLLIGTKTVIALEGARLSDEFSGFGTSQAEEAHFWSKTATATGFPTAIFNQPTAAFIDQVNFVPFSAYSAVDGALNRIHAHGTINGTAGNDYVWAWNPDTTSDSILGGAGNDVIDANTGRDTVYGGEGHDLIAGGVDRDVLYGDNGNDQIWGGTQNDSLYGGAGDDKLHGGSGNDDVRGGVGNDTVNGNEGNDVLRGEDGNDNIGGQNGNDTLYGGAGNDTLTGANGNDTLIGDAGNDVLNGGANNDRLTGGAGRDAVTGSTGNDVFVFQTGDMTNWGATTGTTDQRMAQLDVITDFVIGQDKINFAGISGIDSVSDFTVWKYTVGSNVFFAMHNAASGQRILVDVAYTVEWADFTAASNFIFS